MITKFNSYIKENLSSKLNETILNPNFSVVVPGGCNGKCSFCFWKQGKICENYVSNLLETMNTLPSQFYQLSLTGGEPSLSPYLDKILENIDRNKWKNTVLTSNGTNLLKFIPKMKGVIEHVNISRHHYDDKINESIFGTDTVPNSAKLKQLVNELHKAGIDVTYSAVLTEDLNSKEGVEKYIKFANSHGVKQVFFRKQHGTLDPSEAEQAFESIKSSTHNCPVCRNTTQNIHGTTVVWKASLEEPSKELGMIYEVVYNQNGVLTSDWEQEFPLNPQLIKENSQYNSLLEDCGGSSHRGCGGSSEEEDDSEEAKRRRLLKDRRKKFNKIQRKIREKGKNKNIDESVSNFIKSFDTFQDILLEGCGSDTYSSCGSSDGDTSFSGCGGSSYSGCGGHSTYYSDEEEEETEDEKRERLRQLLLKDRNKKNKKLKRKLKERPENE